MTRTTRRSYGGDRRELDAQTLDHSLKNKHFRIMTAPDGNDYAVGNPGGGAPVGNVNALKHGATASPINLLDHLSEEELQWVESLVDAYLDRAPFGPHDGRVERLTRTCVMIFQEWRAEEAVLSEGMGRETVVGVSSEGTPIVNTEEHYLNRRMDRLNDKIRHNLRDLGLLEEDVGRPGEPGSSGQWVAESEHMTVTITERAREEDEELEDDVDDE